MGCGLEFGFWENKRERKKKLCSISVGLELVFVEFSDYGLRELWDMRWIDDGAGCFDGVLLCWGN